jgi:hypothetical protein
MQNVTREEARRRLVAKAKLLWKLVTTTAGVGDLAEPMARVERNFTHLSSGQRTTVALIAKQFEEGCHAINEDEKEAETASKTEGKPEVVTLEVIPPGEDPKD